MAEKICRLCGLPKDEEKDFYWFFQKDIGRKISRTECKTCNNKKTRAYAKGNPDYYMYQNMKGQDRRVGREFDLTREDVRNLLSSPCEYCGATDQKMSVDRKNNDLGHTRENSVPCCLRCNILKSDMPLAAWTVLVPHVRAAYEGGLFGDWEPHSHQRAVKKAKKLSEAL